MMDVKIDAKSAMAGLGKVSGKRLTAALLDGYRTGAKAVVREGRKTTKVKRKTGQLMKSFRFASRRRPFVHARARNIAPYALFLERKPANRWFLSSAAKEVTDEALGDVKTALIKHFKQVSRERITK